MPTVLISISSTHFPEVFMAEISPPIGFAEPGETSTEVTPARLASSNEWSSGSIASSTLSVGVIFSELSLTSSPSLPTPLPNSPRCVCTSINPG